MLTFAPEIDTNTHSIAPWNSDRRRHHVPSSQLRTLAHDLRVRKEIKIRPGFTPQEDVSRFRGSRQKQMDSNALPKGHIIGWAPPPTSTAPKATGAALSKSAKKNAKRKEKREAAKSEELNAKIKESWEDDDEDEVAAGSGSKDSSGEGKQTGKTEAKSEKSSKTEEDAKTDALVDKLKKLDVA